VELTNLKRLALWMVCTVVAVWLIIAALALWQEQRPPPVAEEQYLMERGAMPSSPTTSLMTEWSDHE